MTVLSPRSVGNTDGIDPDSAVNVLITDSYISVGDDGISIKSDNITAGALGFVGGARAAGAMMPTRNVTMRRLVINSRNWCVGSSTFGGVYDVLLEDSVIGSPDLAPGAAPSNVPWAIKFKSHEYFPGPIENVTVRRVRIGGVGPTPWMYPASPTATFGAFQLGLTYTGGAPLHRSGAPRVRNITFEDIHVVAAGEPGAITGLPESCFQQLTFRNVTFGKLGDSSQWRCHNVQGTSFVHDGVVPPFAGCVNSNGACA